MGSRPYAAGQFTTTACRLCRQVLVWRRHLCALITSAKDVTASRTEFGVRTDNPLRAERHLTLRGSRAAGRMISTSTARHPLFQTLPGFLCRQRRGAGPRLLRW